MPTPIDPQVAAFLATYNASSPLPMRDVPVAQSRAAVVPVPGPPEPVGNVRDVSIDTAAGPLPGRLYESEGGGVGTCVFFHGGGWVTGDLNTHDALCRRLCNQSRGRIVAVDYRLAPEHPFPAASDDAYSATAWAAREFAGPVAVLGDSAGGNLAAVVALMARDQGGPSLAAQVLVYPIVDYHFDRKSYRNNAAGYFLTRETMQWFWEVYVPNPVSALHPYASPLRAESLAGLPPALVITAEYDVLLDEGREYAQRLRDAGVPVTELDCPGMIHGFIRRLHLFRRAGEVCCEIGEFLRVAYSV